MKRAPIDPSGFDCMDCHLRYPWVASAGENDHWHLCRACVAKRPSTRRNRTRHRRPRSMSMSANGWG
jgi:hypothetical protein